MDQHLHLINKFYTALQKGDFKTMQQCYHPDIEFSDEAFPSLKGNQAKAMWQMLVDSGKDSGLQIRYENIKVVDNHVECDWEARYRLSLTGRDVHNKIHATFTFKDDLIIRHIDHFNFYHWARMAFGFKGIVLGWAPFFKLKVQETVSRRLKSFIDKYSEYK